MCRSVQMLEELSKTHNILTNFELNILAKEIDNNNKITKRDVFHNSQT